MNKIPEGMKGIPVPKGVVIGSTESRLDTFSKVCIRENFVSSRESLERIKTAWAGFAKAEKELLKLEALLRELRYLNLVEKLTGIDVTARRRVAIIGLIRKTKQVRIEIMCGRILRPSYVNPAIMLVRA